MHLLIVEPDRTLLETYCAYFDRVGLSTTSARDGLFAKEVYLRSSIDTVLLEPDLPAKDEFLRAIAEHTARRPLPVIVVSRMSRVSLDFPVHGFHVKPVTMSKLLEDVFASTSGCQ